MPAARLVFVAKSDSHCECIVEKRAGWLSLTILDLAFLAMTASIAFAVCLPTEISAHDAQVLPRRLSSSECSSWYLYLHSISPQSAG